MVLSVEGLTRSSNMSSKAVNLKTEDGRVAPSTRSLVRFMLYALYTLVIYCYIYIYSKREVAVRGHRHSRRKLRKKTALEVSIEVQVRSSGPMKLLFH
jgi:hypothetical protein